MDFKCDTPGCESTLMTHWSAGNVYTCAGCGKYIAKDGLAGKATRPPISLVKKRRVRDNLKRARRKHLAPLTRMTVGEILLRIERLNLNQLRALKRAMDSCTTTNCGWVEYEVAGLFYSHMQEVTNRRLEKQKKGKGA